MFSSEFCRVFKSSYFMEHIRCYFCQNQYKSNTATFFKTSAFFLVSKCIQSSINTPWSVYLSIYPSIYLLTIYLTIYISSCLSMYLSTYIYISNYLSINKYMTTTPTSNIKQTYQNKMTWDIALRKTS